MFKSIWLYCFLATSGLFICTLIFGADYFNKISHILIAIICALVVSAIGHMSSLDNIVEQILNPDKCIYCETNIVEQDEFCPSCGKKQWQNSEQVQRLVKNPVSSEELDEEAPIETKVDETFLAILNNTPKTIEFGSAGSSLKTVLVAAEINQYFVENPDKKDLISITIEKCFKNNQFEEEEIEAFKNLEGFLQELIIKIDQNIIIDSTVEKIHDAGLNLGDFDFSEETNAMTKIFVTELSKRLENTEIIE